MENKFKKGLILGGLLAVAAAIGFAMTKEGEALTDDLQQDLKTLAKHLKKNLHEIDDVTKEKFFELAINAVDEYSKKKHLVADAKEKLVCALQAKWREMESEYSAEKM